MSGVMRRSVTVILIVAASLSTPSRAWAQAQVTMRDALSFLLTNRSVTTGDFVRDEEAAARTADAIGDFLLLELATLPITSSGGGFSYRLDPVLGAMRRASASFGPFFAERSLTIGRARASFGVNYQSAIFDRIDDRSLRDGTLVSTASVLASERDPFDVETVTLRIRTDTFTPVVNVGLTDRLDVSGALPFVRLGLSGQRLDTYRGQSFVQALASASATGFGDLVLRAKYNVFEASRGGIALGAETRLPTGDEEQLLGAGEMSIKPRATASIESDRVGLHADVGYAFGGLTDEFDYGAAVTIVAAPRLTFVAEIAGRRLAAAGRLADIVEPHPRIANVSTIRLTSIEQATSRVLAVGGVKWNVGGDFLLSANVRRPLGTAGLNPRWVAAVSVDYSIGASQ
jgi:hypothetical protein